MGTDDLKQLGLKISNCLDGETIDDALFVLTRCIVFAIHQSAPSTKERLELFESVAQNILDDIVHDEPHRVQ